MKVLGGICGIANRKNTLENYFLLSPLLGNISEQFYNYFGILKDDRSIHYQLGVSVNSWYYNNTEKFNTIFANHDVDFTSTIDVYNVITKKVLPADIFLAHDEVGSELFNLFKAEPLYGEKPIWDPVVKRKLPTFAETTKKVNVKVNNKVVQLEEEKKLMGLLRNRLATWWKIENGKFS